MTHEEVIAALTLVGDKGKTNGLSTEDIQKLIGYNLIAIEKGSEKDLFPTCTLTKKGRVMLKKG